jgi:hypothetical protein
MAAAAPLDPPRRLQLPARLYGLHPLHGCDVRLLAAHLNSLVASPEVRDSHFLYGTHPLTRAEVAGVVVRSALSRDRRLLLLDDGTGLAQASVYDTNVDGSPSLLPRADVGDVVVVAGKLASWWRTGRADERCTEVRVRALRKLASLDELSSHQLRTMALHVRCYSQPLRVLMPGIPGLDAFTNPRMLVADGGGGGGGGGGGMQLMARLPDAPTTAATPGNDRTAAPGTAAAALRLAPAPAVGGGGGGGGGGGAHESLGPELTQRVAAVERLLRAQHPWLRAAAPAAGERPQQPAPLEHEPDMPVDPETANMDETMLVGDTPSEDEPPPEHSIVVAPAVEAAQAQAQAQQQQPQLLPVHFTAGILHARLLVEDEAAQEGQFYAFANGQTSSVRGPPDHAEERGQHEEQAPVGARELEQELEQDDEDVGAKEDADMQLTLQALGFLLHCGRLFVATPSAQPARLREAQPAGSPASRKRPRDPACGAAAASSWDGGGGAATLLGVLSVRHVVMPAVLALLAAPPPKVAAHATDGAAAAGGRLHVGAGWTAAQLLAALRHGAATATVTPHALQAALAALVGEAAAVWHAPDGSFVVAAARDALTFSATRS